MTSGFWGGITIGRFVLTHLARVRPPSGLNSAGLSTDVDHQRFGEKKLVFAMCVGTIAFQLLVWFVPNVIGEAGK